MKKSMLFLFFLIWGSLLFICGTIIYFVSSDNSYINIKLETNGGILDKKIIKLKIGDNYSSLPIPKREGYTFDGWFTGVDDGDKITDNLLVKSSDTNILYARWTSDISNLAPIVSVNTSSVQSGEYYGGLVSSKKYINSLNESSFYGGNVYSDNDGLFQYDDNGALLLDADNSIAILDIDNKYKISDNYSLSTTFYWDSSMSSNFENFSSTIVAISANSGEYLSWVGIDKGYLFVYSYYKLNTVPFLTQELRGYNYIDISKFDKSIINIQIVSSRDKKTKLYINGELASEFESGSDVLDYHQLTLGDLRLGRNLKFVGKIYDFAIFDKKLTDEQVKINYKNSFAYKK